MGRESPQWIYVWIRITISQICVGHLFFLEAVPASLSCWVIVESVPNSISRAKYDKSGCSCAVPMRRCLYYHLDWKQSRQKAREQVTLLIQTSQFLSASRRKCKWLCFQFARGPHLRCSRRTMCNGIWQNWGTNSIWQVTADVLSLGSACQGWFCLTSTFHFSVANRTCWKCGGEGPRSQSQVSNPVVKSYDALRHILMPGGRGGAEYGLGSILQN